MKRGAPPRKGQEHAFASCWAQVKRSVSCSLRKQSWHNGVSVSRFTSDACAPAVAQSLGPALRARALPVALAFGGNGVADNVAIFLTLLGDHLRVHRSPYVTFIPADCCTSTHSVLARVVAGVDRARNLPHPGGVRNHPVRRERRDGSVWSARARATAAETGMVASRACACAGTQRSTPRSAAAVCLCHALFMSALSIDPWGALDHGEQWPPVQRLSGSRPTRMPVKILRAWWRGTVACADVGSLGQRYNTAAHLRLPTTSHVRLRGTHTRLGGSYACQPRVCNSFPLLVMFEDPGHCTFGVLDVVVRVLCSAREEYGLPCALVFGVPSIGHAAAARQKLPNAIRGRGLIRNFPLAIPRVAFDCVIDTFFDGAALPLQIGPRTLSWLTEDFLLHHFSLRLFLNRIKFAVMHHFFTKPSTRLDLPLGHGAHGDNVMKRMGYPQNFNTALMQSPRSGEGLAWKGDFHANECVQQLLLHRWKWSTAFNCVYHAVRWRHVARNGAIVCKRNLYFGVLTEGRKTEFFSFIEDAVLRLNLGELCALARGWASELEFPSGRANLFGRVVEDLWGIVTQLDRVRNTRVLSGNEIALSRDRDRRDWLFFSEASEMAAVASARTAGVDHWRLVELSRVRGNGSGEQFSPRARSRVQCRIMNLISSCLKPFALYPLNEMFFYNDVSTLRQCFNVPSRHSIVAALQLQTCSCHRNLTSCRRERCDLSVVYGVLSDCGRFVSMYDLFRSFSAALKAAQPRCALSLPKLKARFRRAVKELEFSGLLSSLRRGNALKTVFETA